MKFLGYEPVFLASWKEHTQSSVMADAMAGIIVGIDAVSWQWERRCMYRLYIVYTQAIIDTKKECLGHRWVMLETLDVFSVFDFLRDFERLQWQGDEKTRALNTHF